MLGTVVIHEVSRLVHILFSELSFLLIGKNNSFSQVYTDGAAAADGRLRPGDQVLEVTVEPSLLPVFCKDR